MVDDEDIDAVTESEFVVVAVVVVVVVVFVVSMVKSLDSCVSSSFNSPF